MKSFGSVLFLLFRLLCYVVLVVVIVGFGAMIVLTATGACPQLGTGDVTCSTPFYPSLGEFSLAVMLASVFTGFPLLLAFTGVFFAIRSFFLWRRSRAAPPSTADASLSPGAQPAQPQSFGMFLLKGFGIMMADVFMLGIIGGMMGSGGS